MFDIEILEPIRDKFASEPLGPILAFPRFCDNPPEKFRKIIHRQLELVTEEIVDQVLEKQSFRFQNRALDAIDLAREAKIWAVATTLSKSLPQYRLRAAQEKASELYSLDALSDINFDIEGLVPMGDFEGKRSLLIRRDYAFSIMPTVQSSNSSYWLTLALRRTDAWKSAKIKLDPFMWGPKEEFPQMEYRMWSWGKRLTWSDLLERSKDSFGEWIPSEFSTRAKNTQYVWVNDKHEAQLEIEELHPQGQINERGTRYCHAIYDKRKSAVVHLDGAIRVLTENEWDIRNSTHLKDIGKIGKRIKIFRIDKPIKTHTMSMLCMNFFIWNYDIARFFGADVPDEL